VRRRDLLFAGTAMLAASRIADAEPADKARRIAVLMSTAEGEAYERAAVAAFIQALEQLGWMVGRNLEISYRWGQGDAARMAANAREIVALSPELIFVKGANLPSLAALKPTMPMCSRCSAMQSPNIMSAAWPAPAETSPGSRAASAGLWASGCSSCDRSPRQ
jgi:hypothetical protein